jgi:COP9 signalosome complex subunit 1
MGHRDLANFHHKAGDLQAAIRMHTKTRDYCAMSSHVVDMCLAVIEVALELANYAIVKNYVIKAEAALEASAGGSGAQPKAKVVNLPGMVQQGLTKKEEATERARTATIERLSVASGVAEMGQGNYERAAFLLLKGTANARGDDAQHYISPADIALYAVFCGLATMDRQQIKRRLLENAELRPLLEGESWLKELMAAFHESRYQRFLELLATYNPRPALDLHLSAQLKQLLPRIQNRAVVQYFQPYGSVSLGKMALAFGWQEDKMLKQIVELVSSGQLQARIDSKNKVRYPCDWLHCDADSREQIIKAHKPSQRAALFKEALEIGEQTERASHALVTRIKLIQADLIVKDRAARDDD